MEYRYQLAPYAGKQSRLVCPNCGRREFSPYIDTETGEILDETCGRCNRESNCSYHLTPSQYFQQHPEARPKDEDWRTAPDWLSKRQTTQKPILSKPRPSGPICELPRETVERTIRMEPPSNLVKFLDNILDPLITEGVVFLYGLGVTKAGETIFYQKDRQGRYRGGKVIQYDPQTGHRVKHADFPVYWIHQSFQRKGLIPQDWKMTQCIFGEHFLDQYPDQILCLVEAEKTAVICAGFMPEYTGLATGGKTQLNERLDVLRGREVIAFPDIDATDAWTEYFNSRTDLNVTVSMLLEENATEQDREDQIDIADLLIRWYGNHPEAVPPVPSVPSQGGTERPPKQYANPVVNEIARFFSPEVLPEVAVLIEDFDLVPVSIQRINPTENEDSDR